MNNKYTILDNYFAINHNVQISNSNNPLINNISYIELVYSNLYRLPQLYLPPPLINNKSIKTTIRTVKLNSDHSTHHYDQNNSFILSFIKQI